MHTPAEVEAIGRRINEIRERIMTALRPEDKRCEASTAMLYNAIRLCVEVNGIEPNSENFQPAVTALSLIIGEQMAAAMAGIKAEAKRMDNEGPSGPTPFPFNPSIN